MFLFVFLPVSKTAEMLFFAPNFFCCYTNWMLFFCRLSLVIYFLFFSRVLKETTMKKRVSQFCVILVILFPFSYIVFDFVFTNISKFSTPTFLKVVSVVSSTLWRQTLKSPQSFWRPFRQTLFRISGSNGRAYSSYSYIHAFFVIATWSYSQFYSGCHLAGL